MGISIFGAGDGILTHDLSDETRAEDGSQIEPFTLHKLNYTTFFADREQTELLAFQLKQLNDYLELKGSAYT